MFLQVSKNHHHLAINNFVFFLSELLDFYSSICFHSRLLSKHSSKVVFGYSNLERSHPVMSSFMNTENFINLVKGNTCSMGKWSCIDVLLKSRSYYFKHTSSTETGLSDHHHLISSMIKTTFEEEESKVLI